MIGDLCGDPYGEEWGQEYDDDADPTDDTCCYEQGGPERCYCAERAEDRPVVTVQPTGGVL